MRSPLIALLFKLCTLVILPVVVDGFVSHQKQQRWLAFSPPTTRHHQVQADPNNFLFDDFRMFNGEVVDPYKVLKLHRSAERPQIRAAYIEMSRKYHPDSVRHKGILPGSCNNHDEVRDQWERIKLAYEILSDNRMRKRYDRHEVIADPGAAAQRAAMDATGNAIKGVGKGMFNVGKGLFDLGAKAVSERNNQEKRQPEEP